MFKEEISLLCVTIANLSDSDDGKFNMDLIDSIKENIEGKIVDDEQALNMYNAGKETPSEIWEHTDSIIILTSLLTELVDKRTYFYIGFYLRILSKYTNVYREG